MKVQHSILIAGAIVALSFVFTDFAHRAEGADAVEARLRKLEDIDAIHALLVDYGRALDQRDFEAYGALFAQDGSWKGGMGTATGPAAIAKMVAAGFERMQPALYTGSNHVMTSFDVDVDVDGDTATAWSRWTWVVVGADGKPQAERAGHYEDTLVRERDAWKFKSRQAFTEINP